MGGFSQQGYNAGPGSLIGRIVAFAVGAGVLAISVFVGAVFLAAIVGLVLILGLVFTVRVWWLRRKMERYAAEHGDIEGEYTVVRKETRSIEEHRYRD